MIKIDTPVDSPDTAPVVEDNSTYVSPFGTQQVASGPVPNTIESPTDPTVQAHYQANPTITNQPAVNPYLQELATKPESTDRSLVKDAFAQNNSAYATYEWLKNRDTNPIDGKYDAWRDDEVLFNGLEEDQKNKAIDFTSRAQFQGYLKTIDNEQRAKQNISESGGYGMAASLAAGILDPINLIPIVGQSTKVKVAVALGTAALDEAVLQKTQETRTASESAMNIGTAGVFTGTLLHLADRWGGSNAVKKLNETITDTHDQPDLVTQYKELNPVPKSGGAAAVTVDENKLVGGSVIEALTLGEGAKLFTSPSLAARNLGHTSVENAFVLQKHLNGSYDVPDETLIKVMTNEMVGGVVNGHLDDFKAAKKLDPTLTKDQFDSNIRAAAAFDFQQLTGAATGNPILDQSALRLRTFFETMGQRLHAAGLLPNPDNVRGAMYYVPRLYDGKKIAANPVAFQEDITRKLIGQWGNLTPAKQRALLRKFEDHNNLQDAARTTARDIYESITYGADEFKALNERKVTLDDLQLSEWLENDPIKLVTRYADKYIPKLVMAENKNVTSFDQFFKTTADDYTNMVMEAERLGDKGEIKSLNKRKVVDKAAAQNLYDRLLNIHPQTKHPAVQEFFESMKQLSSMSQLGMVTVTSITDVARQVTINGPAKAMKYELQALQNVVGMDDIVKLSRAEKKALVAPLEELTNMRFSHFVDLFGDYDPTNPMAQLINYAHGKFMTATGLPKWTASQKTTAAEIITDKIISAGKKLDGGGKLTKAEVTHFAQIGLTESKLRAIHTEYKFHGQDNLLNHDKWSNQNAAESIKQAIVRSTDKTINTVNAGELHAWMDSPISKILMQFQSFAMVAWNQTLIAGLQRSDANFYMSVVGMLGLGILATELKAQLTGAKRPTSWDLDDPTGWVATSFDRSGLVSLPFDLYNRGAAVLGQPTFGSQLDRAIDPIKEAKDQQFSPGVAFGPVGRYVDNFGKAVFNHDKNSVAAARRLMPLQNLHGASLIFDQVEKGLNHLTGTPYKEKDTLNPDNIFKGSK